MSQSNTLGMRIFKLALLVVVLTTNACHSSSDSDNGTPPNDELLTPALSESNWRFVVGEVFDVFTQAIYDDQLIQPAYSTIAGQDYQFPFANSDYETYSENECTNGGVVTQRRSPTSCDGRCFSSTRMLYACSSSGHSLLGRVETESDYSGLTRMYDALAITSGGGQKSTIDGNLGINRLGSKISDNIRRSATLSRYESTTKSGTTVLVDVDTVFGYGTDQGDDTASAELQGTLVLRSPNTGDAIISATVTVPFINENSEERRFPRGTLKLQAEDGSRIELTADNGNIDTFDVILNNDDVNTVTLSEPWSDWIERLSFNQP